MLVLDVKTLNFMDIHTDSAVKNKLNNIIIIPMKNQQENVQMPVEMQNVMKKRKVEVQ